MAPVMGVKRLAGSFWRTAYDSDLVVMRLLIDGGADPNIPTMKGLSRPMTNGGVRACRGRSFAASRNHLRVNQGRCAPLLQ
jgi:hypothetical protein